MKITRLPRNDSTNGWSRILARRRPHPALSGQIKTDWIVLGAGFVPVRKRGRLPAATHSVSYELEYGIDELEIHRDALDAGRRVLVVDDLLATGGTAAAATELVGRSGATLVGYSFLIELADLQGRDRLAANTPVSTLVVE